METQRRCQTLENHGVDYHVNVIKYVSKVFNLDLNTCRDQ